MIVYADVLVFLNIIVTYFILLATKCFSRASAKTYKIVLASLVGGVSSLYIFLPQQPFLVEILLKLLFSAIITVIAFSAVPFKRYIRSVFSFYAVSFIYAGFMLAFWYVLKPKGMVINNGIVYFSVSPIVLILSTVFCYGVIIFAGNFYKKSDANAQKVAVTISRGGSDFLFDCMVDTGNSLTDPLGNDKIIILSKSSACEMFGNDCVERLLKLSPAAPEKFRVLPYKTALGSGLMPAVKVESAAADNIKNYNVLVGIINDNFTDFGGIISPSFFD